MPDRSARETRLVRLGATVLVALSCVACDRGRQPGRKDGAGGDAPAPTSGRALHVDVHDTRPGGDGTAARPFGRIQAAVDAARDGDTIRVAQGRYEHGNIDMKSRALTVLGGFAGGTADTYAAGKPGDFTTRDAKRFVTTVVGNPATNDPKKDPAAVFYFVASAGGTLDGLTITGGRHGVYSSYNSSDVPLTISNSVIEGNGVDKPDYYEYGGGIHSEYRVLVVRGNVIRNNKSGRGGGLSAFGSGKARIEDNRFVGNVGLGDHGGGAFLGQPGSVKGNVFEGNQVTGALVNWVGGVGGGVVVVGVDLTMSDNRYTDNFAKKCGAGVFVDEGAHVVMDHELVFRNKAPVPEGNGGAGVYVDGGSEKISTLEIVHSTVVDNAPLGPGRGNGLYLAAKCAVTVRDSIFWGNGGDDAAIEDPASASVQAKWSVFRSSAKGVTLGPGVTSAAPLFADGAKGDYHLRSRAGRWDPAAAGGRGDWVVDAADSPGIDAADPASPFDREPAPNGGRADLGVFGNTPFASRSSGAAATSPSASARPGANATAPSAAPPSSAPAAVTTPPAAAPNAHGCATCGASGASSASPASGRDGATTFLAALAAVAMTRRRARHRAVS